MSTLRRRFLGDTFSSTKPSRELSPAKGEPVALVSKSHLKELKGKRGKRWQFSIFGLGGLFGLVVAAIFANQHDVINLEGLVDFNMESLLDVIPAGIVNDAKDLTVRCFQLARSTWETHKLKLIRSSCSQRHERETVNYDSFSVGLHLQSQGVRALHPVIMIPGVVSTGLESWGTQKESIQYFRKRLWGSWSMMRALVLDKASWKRHIMLDTLTGLDPPGIKLRAAQGFGELRFPSHRSPKYSAT